MDFIFAAFTLLIGFAGLGLAAQAWGVDSRETFADPRHR
jgi:hypothetical protein